jgi:hypothetical protein
MLKGSGLHTLLIVIALVAPTPPLLAQDALERMPAARPDPPALAATTASALLPGAGQLWQGRGRWVAFLALEAVGVGIHVDARADGRQFRRAYRDLAWEAARGAPLPRIDPDFEYFERLTRWARSGRYDADPATPGLQPERDPTSYNGAQWKLAADIHLDGDLEAGPGTVGYDEALRFYQERAYEETLTWDWSGAPGEQLRFRRLIEDSDARFQRATSALAVVAANHVLSAIDAFVAGRSGRRSPVSVRLHPGSGAHVGPILVASIPLSWKSP